MEAELVTFFSDGVKLQGEMFIGAGDGATQKPAVVIAHGFGGIKAFFVGDIAQTLSEAGFVVLTFDYRGFGESDGPRNRLRPMEQVDDLLRAVEFLKLRPEVDPSRVATYGVSFGGGIAVAAAAKDPSIKSVVCAVGIADCATWLRSLRRHWEWLEFEEVLAQDRVARLTTGKSRIVEPEVIMVRDPESEHHEKYLRDTWPDRAFQLDLASGDAILDFRPKDYVSKLGDRPLLLIGVTEDGLTPYDQTLELQSQASGPTSLITLTGCTHHDIYKPQYREGLMIQIVDFLQSSF